LSFEGRGIGVGGNVQNLVLENNYESCPRCGGAARIVEGEFNIRDGVFEVLRSTRLNRDLLQRFAVVAKQAQEGSIPMEQAASQIAEESPALASLLERVPIAARKAVIWVLLQTLVILAAQVVAESRDHDATPQQVKQAIKHNDDLVQNEMQQAVERALKDYYRDQQSESRRTSGARHATKTPRNAPCPCGSGQKYKKCCGQ
jgi:hypothetical protein